MIAKIDSTYESTSNTGVCFTLVNKELSWAGGFANRYVMGVPAEGKISLQKKGNS